MAEFVFSLDFHHALLKTVLSCLW